MIDIVPNAFTSHRRATVIVWTLMAALNVTAAVVIASWPDRQWDLDTIQRWGGNWLLRGEDVYVRDPGLPDYPPHAMVLLSPLGVMSHVMAVPVWGGVNVALLFIAPYVAVRRIRPDLPRAAALLPILMFVCWSGSRTLLQFSLFALTLALTSSLLSPRYPLWSGICLGAALMKPHVAIPFLAAALIARRWTVVAAAFGTIAAGTAVYCARAATNPVDVARRYAAVLDEKYGGDPIVVGLAQLRPLFRSAASSGTADVLSITAAVALLAVLCMVARKERGEGERFRLAAPGMAALWSLLTFYHLTYGFLILMPLAVQLLFEEIPATRTFRARLFWSLQLGLMFDVPGLARHLGSVVALPVWVDVALRHFDRAFMLALYAAIAVLAMKTARLSAVRRDPATLT